jgi:alkanesulfonate monooxygenase SsuD/methylene tetrahydromethanopterin reductase-like flavin-dependent oxidoreductase (luciferase family)
MKFGIFDYIDKRDEPLPRTYDERIALVQAAEDAGFYCYHLTEHHNTPLSMTPSPTVYLAALARETARIRLSTLLFLLPLYHPMRLIEELLMLDNLSHGRLDIGVGRGISPPEFKGFNVDFDANAEMFAENFEVLHKGLTGKRLTHHGKRWQFDNVPIVMQPVQKPHPPYWYGLRGETGPVFAAKHGMNGVSIGPDFVIKRLLAEYRAAWTKHAAERGAFGSANTTPIAGAMRSMFIADTDEAADRAARPAYKHWFDALCYLWREHNLQIAIAIPEDFDKAVASGAVVVGSPDTVRKRLVGQARECGFDYLVLMLAFGTLGHAAEMRSLDLFRREVMPALMEEKMPA